MRRGRWWWALVLLFVVLPLVELYFLVQLGQVIGAWWTILVVVVIGVGGTYLMKREGGRAWRALREALGTGRMPGTELADGALVLIGGTLLLTPGFVTDAAGLFCVLPFTRPLARGVLARAITKRLVVLPQPGAGPFPGAARERRSPGPDVVRGEVVDDD